MRRLTVLLCCLLATTAFGLPRGGASSGGSLVLPGKPTGVGSIATALGGTSPTSSVTNYIDWTAPSAGTYSIASYDVYANGTLLANTGSTATDYTDSSGTATIGAPQPKYTVAAVDSQGNVGPQSTAYEIYIYHNALGVNPTGFTTAHVSALFAQVFPASTAGVDSTTQVPSGDTHSLQITTSGVNGLTAFVSTNYDGTNSSWYGTAPYGFDLTPFAALEFKWYPYSSSDDQQIRGEYEGLYSGTNDVIAGTFVTAMSTVPGVTTPYSSGWNSETIPLMFIGLSQQKGHYKFYPGELSGSGAVYYYADLGFASGTNLTLYSGGAPNSYNNGSPGSWNNDASTLLNGFSDASSVTPDYSYPGADLTQINAGVASAGGGSANGLTAPGLGATPTNVIQVEGTDAYWEARDSSCVTLTGEDHISFALLPTSSTRSWTIQAVNASGTLIGNSVALPGAAGTYTNSDNGPGSGTSSVYWTTFRVPLSAIGFSGSSFCGLRITDTSGVSSNTWYISGMYLDGITT